MLLNVAQYQLLPTLSICKLMHMEHVTIKPAWVLENKAGDRAGPELFALLNAVLESGKLTNAALQLGVSYRHAWNSVARWNVFFGAPLVRLERGKGAFLTPLAERLLWAEQRVRARLGPQLESLASELNLEINRLLAREGTTIRVHASHGFAVARLPDLLRDHPQIQIDLRYLGSVESLASLARGACDLAGFHVAEGELGREALERYRRWLNPAAQRLVHLVTRTQGLFLARGNPKAISGLEDLRRPNVVFINRQNGAGTRLLFDQLLARQGISPQDVVGYQTEEFTHAAVAAYVASGTADVGFGVEPAARQFQLDFLPLARERYLLLCQLTTLERPELTQLLHLLRSPQFQKIVASLPGYSAPQAGAVVRLEQAFPELLDPRRPPPA